MRKALAACAVLSLLFVDGCASQTATTARQPTAGLPIDANDRVIVALAPAQISSLSADVGCSHTLPRIGYAIVTWAGSANLDTQPLRVDVSIDPDGFESGDFVSAYVSDSSSALRPNRVKVSAVKARAYNIRVTKAVKSTLGIATETPTRAIVIENLEQGDYYFVRLVARTATLAATSTIQFLAPSCVADVERG